MGTESRIEGNEPELLRHDTGGVATLTMNRPRARNALSGELLDALQRELDAIADDQSVRAVVIAGAGPAFCAGHDMRQLRANPRRDYYDATFAKSSNLMMSILRLPQPVVARVHGMASAAGCQLVASCDLAVAATEAKFATPGVDIGLFCSTPMVALSRNLGRKESMEMLLLGEVIPASRAQEMGLVNKVVSPDELDDAVARVTDTICAKSALTIAMGKQAFYRQMELGVSDAYAFASDVMAKNMLAADAEEGIDAFLQKRQPVWRGK